MKRIDKVPHITMPQFEMRQPDGKKDSLVDGYYYDLTNRLISVVNNRNLLPEWPGVVVARGLMGIVGYFQDIVADSGVWRSFINMNRRLYGKTLPFYEVSEEYVDHELNPEDIRFLLWYSLSLNYEDKYTSDPLADDVRVAADAIYEILDSVYEDAPEDVCWKQTRELEISDPEDARRIYRYSNWLFMYCYLMSPAYSRTLMNIMGEPEMQSPDSKTIEQRLERSMVEDPVGPLALFLKEWLYLIIEGHLPENAPEEDTVNVDEHPYWRPFTEAAKGERILFFKNYEELNTFFVNILGWSKGENHLPQLRSHRDFVLLVDRRKGMLLAKDVARCIRYVSNPYYDQEYAKQHAMDLLTVRGLCPVDLLKFIEANNALPDAHFSGSDNTTLVADNFDFIARCYLQLYYRGD